jgi:hypothetical protein
MSGLTIEDLAALIAQAPKAKKPRKKADQTPEQRELMLEKLALMREKSLENRKSKPVAVVSKPEPKAQPQGEYKGVRGAEALAVQPNQDLFEKHYNSKFEELKESINGINSSINQMKQLKLEKAKKKAEIKEKTEEIKEGLKQETLSQNNAKPQGDDKVIRRDEPLTPTLPQNLNPNKIMKPQNYKSFFKR